MIEEAVPEEDVVAEVVEHAGEAAGSELTEGRRGLEGAFLCLGHVDTGRMEVLREYSR